MTPKLACHLSPSEILKFKNLFRDKNDHSFPLVFFAEVKLPFETFIFPIKVFGNFWVSKFPISGPQPLRKWTDFTNEFVYANLTPKSFPQRKLT